MLTSSQEKEIFLLREERANSSPSSQMIVRPDGKNHRAQAILEFEAESSTVPQLVKHAEVLARHQERHLARVLLREALTQDTYHVSTLRRLYDLLDPDEWTLQERTKIAEALCEATHLASDTLRLAKLEYEKGNLERSLSLYFEAASQIQDEDRTVFEIYKDVGNIYVRQGDFDGAEEYYHKAFALDPDSDVLYVNLGTLEIQRQDWGSARERFRAALSLNERNDKAWVGLALSHYHLGDTDLAFANLTKALDFSPYNRTAVLLLAGWGAKHLRFAEAEEALERFLAEISFDEEISLALIEIFCAQRLYPLALLEIERVLVWNPLRSDLYELEIKIKGVQALESNQL